MKKGDKVYIKALKTIGVVTEMKGEKASYVKIQTPTGEEIINTIGLIVTIAKAVDYAMDFFYPFFKKWYFRIFKNK